ncbi:hypothetical protein LguiB_012818 [Lonicera macranthoides]
MDHGLFQSPQFLASKELESRGSVDTPIPTMREGRADISAVEDLVIDHVREERKEER